VWCSTGKDWIVDLLSAHQPTTDMSLESSLLQQIQANFTAAAEHYVADVGGLYWVESLHAHVAFFLLNDATDQDSKARSRLPAGPQIHQCNVKTTLFTHTHFRRASSTAFERDREFWNLHSFLGSVSYGRVLAFPSEQLFCVDSITSVCDRLRQQLSTSSTSTSRTAVGNTDTAASLVFIRRTSSSSVVHAKLLHRVFTYAQNELLTTGRSVYIVTDVGMNVRLPVLKGILEPSSRNVHTNVYSGAKPLFSPISCIVIALHLSDT